MDVRRIKGHCNILHAGKNNAVTQVIKKSTDIKQSDSSLCPRITYLVYRCILYGKYI